MKLLQWLLPREEEGEAELLEDIHRIGDVKKEAEGLRKLKGGDKDAKQEAT